MGRLVCVFLPACFAALMFAACGGDDYGGSPGDAGGLPDGGTDGGADAAVEREPECPAEPDEDCNACFVRVGECCKPGDAEWLDRQDEIAAACQSDPFCAACCDECAAMTCSEMRDRHLCPGEPGK